MDETNETNTDTTRKLSSIKIVDNIIPHPNANSLELSIIGGWQIVTRIGETKIGDKVIYCEIDSLLPNQPWLPQAIKLKLDNQKENTWFRLKTIKIRSEISQGLIIPISGTIEHMKEYEIDTDVTKELGIKKYEDPAFSDPIGISTDKFPTNLIDKTDEPRIQSSVNLLSKIQNLPYYITVKCDGTSATFLINPSTQELLVCSRNQIRSRPDNLEDCPYWSIAVKYDIENKLSQMEGRYAIQGEICGPKIQKNLLGLDKLDLFIFNIIDIPSRRKVPYSDFVKITEQLQIKTVPIEEVGNVFDITDIKTLLSKAEGKYKNTKNHREGLVIRSQDCNISFKVISNAYLLKYD